MQGIRERTPGRRTKVPRAFKPRAFPQHAGWANRENMVGLEQPFSAFGTQNVARSGGAVATVDPCLLCIALLDHQAYLSTLRDEALYRGHGTPMSFQVE